MKCNVILDLIPLYVDDCCSEESSKLVQEHLESCESCRRTYSDMSQKNSTPQTNAPPVKIRRISDWKAGILQSALLYFSFALIVFGVIFEGHTPEGPDNGLWAAALIIPGTANLLSLANWYFIRVYKNRKMFSNFSCLITLLMIVGGYSWIYLHYADGVVLTNPLVIGGAVLSVTFIVLSKVFSNLYGKLLGRE